MTTIGRWILVAALLAMAGCTSSGNRPETPGEPRPSQEGASETPAPTATTPPAGPAPSARAHAKPDQDALNRRLIAAAWDDDVARARRLIAAGADVNAKDKSVQSAYLIATSEGHERLLDLTLARGGNVRSLDSYRGTGLIRAADRGHARVVGRLLRAGVRVDHVNRLGWVALHEAIVLGDGSGRYVDTVRALVAGGADLTIRSRRDGRTPSTLAARQGHDRIGATLRAGLATPSITRAEANTRLTRAARSGDADGVAVALRAGADIETRDSRRRTPLLIASLANNVAVARLLVAMGADPDAADQRQDTAWLVTGVTGSVEMLEALLPARPDLGRLNRFGGTSIIPAGERGHVAYVRRAIRTDIDLDHVNDLGWTVLLEAVVLGDGSRRYQQIVQALVDADVDIAISDRNGVDAITHARQRGFEEIARILERAS